MRLKKRCKTFGCPNLHTNETGYCDKCTAKYRDKHPKQDPEGRPSASKRGYDATWHRFAKDYLKAHPTCAICGKPAEVVDHKDQTADMMLDAWGRFDYDPSHYQSLCRSCNVIKGRTADKQLRSAYYSQKAKAEKLLKGGS